MHDANGTPLKKGDKVMIEAEIVELSPHEDYCNVSLETTRGRRPDGNKEHIAINTGVLVKLSSAALALVFCAFLMTGCTPKQDATAQQAVTAVEQNLPQIVTAATKFGLAQWAKKDAAAAKLGATLIAQNVRTVLLPYFQGGPLPMAQAAQIQLSAFGRDKVPAAAQLAIVGVLGVVSAVVSVPGPDGYMTERQRTDVVAGLTALAAACEAFAAK